VPIAHGGRHEPSNIQTAHFICNARKSHTGTGDQLLLIG
jgi:5-methylcytosine-specific restriction endonuclease McrA